MLKVLKMLEMIKSENKPITAFKDKQTSKETNKKSPRLLSYNQKPIAALKDEQPHFLLMPRPTHNLQVSSNYCHHIQVRPKKSK